MNGSRHRRTSGFALIEILVSFTILALVLGAVLGALSSGMRAVTGSEAYTRAVLLARSKLEAVRAEGGVEIGETTGALDDESGQDGRYRWRLTVRPYDDEPEIDFSRLPVEPLAIDVEVSWEEDGAPRSVALTTLHLEPTR